MEPRARQEERLKLKVESTIRTSPTPSKIISMEEIGINIIDLYEAAPRHFLGQENSYREFVGSEVTA